MRWFLDVYTVKSPPRIFGLRFCYIHNGVVDWLCWDIHWNRSQFLLVIGEYNTSIAHRREVEVDKLPPSCAIVYASESIYTIGRVG